jgi:hypothetical protein
MVAMNAKTLMVKKSAQNGIEELRSIVDARLCARTELLRDACDVLVQMYNDRADVCRDALDRLKECGIDTNGIDEEMLDELIDQEIDPGLSSLGLAVEIAHQSREAIDREIERLVIELKARGVNVRFEKRR